SVMARARDVRDLADLVGPAALSATDQLYLACEAAVRTEVVAQERAELRALDDTLDRVWRALGRLPRRELTMLPPTQLAARYVTAAGGPA
ncbi:MAG: ATP synthase beta subunit C-terminal domain-containing protein, partial [Kineosporiaceae bacterium]